MKKLTALEQKLLDEVIRPAISTMQDQPEFTPFYISSGLKYELHFDILLKQVKKFYQNNEGTEWYKVMIAADIN